MINVDQKSAAIVDALADLLLDVVKNGKVVEVENDETGELIATRVTPDASLLNVVRQFVKDFPPLMTPVNYNTTGMLKQFSKQIDKSLPFAKGAAQ